MGIINNYQKWLALLILAALLLPACSPASNQATPTITSSPIPATQTPTSIPPTTTHTTTPDPTQTQKSTFTSTSTPELTVVVWGETDLVTLSRISVEQKRDIVNLLSCGGNCVKEVFIYRDPNINL